MTWASAICHENALNLKNKLRFMDGSIVKLDFEDPFCRAFLCLLLRGPPTNKTGPYPS